MQTLRCVKKTRVFLCPFTSDTSYFVYSTTAVAVSTDAGAVNSYSTPFLFQSHSSASLKTQDVIFSFREWFKNRGNPLFDRIFEILGVGGDEDDLTRRQAADLALSRLGLRLTEALVLEVLGYGKDVLSCLKFFDWAGRQPGFFHTQATFNAIFKILAKAKLMSLMLDFLETYNSGRCHHKGRFFNVLVMGYAVAGKPEVALNLFGKMRFKGIDLDGFSYHVLLNALVEEGCFDVVETIAKQIKRQGFESEVTHSILVKSFCKQGEMDKAEDYFRKSVANGVSVRKGFMVCILVDGYCKKKQFEKAGKLVEEFGGPYVHDVWIRELVQARKFDGALEFVHKNSQKTLPDRYVPDVFRYNTLIWTLLRENRLQEVCDLIIEMRENNISPDGLTLNYVLCFFCKAGMPDVALNLFNSRGEFGLSPGSMAYNYLINTLCGDGSVNDAYRVLKNSINQGYFPWKKTFSILADALCRSGKLDKMMELVLVALENNFKVNASVYDRFISALCWKKRVEDGYTIHTLVRRLNIDTSKSTYYSLIHGFSMSKRGDIAVRLLLEMQGKGHSPTRLLMRTVIQSLCSMENTEKLFWRLLQMQLSHHNRSVQVFNFFIEGAGHANKPDLARQVYELMRRNGIVPTVDSNILMLNSYLKNARYIDAQRFFNIVLLTREGSRKLRNALIVGLCKANMLHQALYFFWEFREDEKKFSLDCYEELVRSLCAHGRYHTCISIIDDLIRVGRHISPFIGNTLLYHSNKSPELYDALERSKNTHDETSWIWTFGELIDVFSDTRVDIQNIERLEEVIRKCFPLDTYTYNMLLRKLSMKQIDDACNLFDKFCQKGYKPDWWTFYALVLGYYKSGRTSEAGKWVEEMKRRGFNPHEMPVSKRKTRILRQQKFVE